MYYYIYDSFLNDKKYFATLNRIETRLMDLGINGRIEKLSVLKSLKEVVNDAIKKGATTLVPVGNDETLSKIISLLPDLEITLGIIPLGPNNQIASILGIPEGEAACDVLSSRIIEKIDLGKANESYFISTLAIPAQPELVIDCGSYLISPLSSDSVINICNFSPEAINSAKASQTVCNPRDGILEAVITSTKKNKGAFGFLKKKYSQDSVFPVKKIKIKCSSECLPLLADGQTTIKTPVTVQVAPKKLKIIVGKRRMF